MAFKPKYQSPKSVSDILDRTLGFVRTGTQRTSVADKMRDYPVFSRWREIVGSDIAAVATPEKLLKRSILVIRVIDAAWMQELVLRKGELLSQIQQIEDGARIQDIRFLAGDPKRVGHRE